MDILLSHGYFILEDERELAIMKPYVPLGILYISAYLEQNGYHNEVFDSTFQSFTDLENRLINAPPRLLCLYTNLMTKLNVLKIISFVKTNPALKNVTIILGGPEVTHHAQNFLNFGADIVVVGEGEITMLQLVSHIDTFGLQNLEVIHGICYMQNGSMIKTQARDKIKDLDLLPIPNRKKVNLQLYFDAWKKKHNHSSISISTMRGCPYTCKWCSRAVYGQSYRRRSPKAVANEISILTKSYNFDSIWFVDDVFTVSHKWIEEFTHEIQSKNLSISFECITRADRLNPEIFTLLKQAGCFRVWIGAESGSQKIIDAMDRRVDVLQVREMIIEAKRNGIEAGTFIMLGYPGETIDDINQTVNHLKASNPDHFTLTLAYPITGTELHTQVADNIINDLPWQSSTDRQKYFKRTYSKKFYKWAISYVNNEVHYHKIKNNPQYIWHSKLKVKLKKNIAKYLMLINS